VGHEGRKGKKVAVTISLKNFRAMCRLKEDESPVTKETKKSQRRSPGRGGIIEDRGVGGGGGVRSQQYLLFVSHFDLGRDVQKGRGLLVSAVTKEVLELYGKVRWRSKGKN